MIVPLRYLSAIAVFLVGVAGFRGWSQNSPGSRLLPAWAYVDPQLGNPGAGAPRSTAPIRIPGSNVTHVEADFSNLFDAPDWFPDAHPPMPEIVAHGRKPDAFACAFCHLPNGLARPENESIAGLPAAYMVQQLQDFKSGLRKSSDPKMTSVAHMTDGRQSAQRR